MASLKSEELHPFIPVEDDKFPGSVLMRGLEVGGGTKLLQQGLLHMFLPRDHHGAFVWGAVLSHQTKWVSVAALSTQPHQGPSHGCSSTQECIQEGAVIKASPGSTENGSLDTGPRQFCRAAHPGCVLIGEGGGELSTADRHRFQFCSKLHVFAYFYFSVKSCLYRFNFL